MRRILASPKLGVTLCAVAVLQQCLGHHNADNSWLISVAERWLAGAQPYVDVLETNPPGAFLIYAPAAALGRLLHLPSEFVVSSMIFVGTLALLLWLRRRLVAAGALAADDGTLFVNAGVFALLLLPGFSFGEREHLAAICVLPILGAYAIRSLGASVSVGTSILAGLLAAVALVAKPYFALAILLPLIWLVWRQRRLGLLFGLEHWAAAALVGFYLASLPIAFPAFFQSLPAIVEVYVPIRTPLVLMLGKSWFLLNLVLVAAILVALRRDDAAPLPKLLLLASLGFLLTYLVQMKGWVNHGLPGVALAFLSAATAIAPALRSANLWQAVRRPVLFLMLPALLGAPILFGTIIQFTGWEEYDGLTAAVRRHTPPHPRLASITGELDVGHPLVHRVGGTWAMRTHSLWLMTCAMTLLQDTKPSPEMAERLRGYIAQDAHAFREDVAANKPDLIIAQTDGTIAPVLRHPDIVAALKDYAPVQVVGSLTLYGRRD
jgi:hypothetical protein